MRGKKILLLILDGWGIGNLWGGNPITIARTPNYDKLLRTYSNTKLQASGTSVGLPGDEVGNSEVGHMNIGAGNVVRQDILIINESIQNGEFYNNFELTQAIKLSKEKNTTVHLMGIISDGGIHSHIIHLFALMKLCKTLGHNDVQLHCFTDGRDTPSMKGVEFLNKIKYVSQSLKIGQIATIIGRSFLDRKGDFKKTQVAYQALVDESVEKMSDPLSAISSSYKKGESDEFIKPIIIEGSKRIRDNDTVIFYNFRSDRTRQLVSAFLDPNFEKFKRKRLLNLDFITFIPYGIEKELGVQAKSAFPAISIDNTIGKFYESLGERQFHIAETEKFAHVTYFINGNREEPYKGEERVLIPSPDVHSYAQKPEMSVFEVTDNLIKRIKSDDFSFYICNFANGDMVGHTGDFQAALKAVESIDLALKKIVDVATDQNMPVIITADHGNIELMLDPLTGEPHNEHTSNPVPAIIVSNQKYKLKSQAKISNLVSTCFQLSEVEKPQHFSDSIIEQQLN